MGTTRRDLILGAAAAGVVQLELWLREPAPASAVLALAAAAVAARRSQPVAMVIVVVAALVADAAAGGVLAGLATPFALAVAACLLLGLHGRTTRAVAVATAAAIAGMTVANQLAPGVTYSALDDLVFFALLLGTPAALGRLLRRRADVIAELALRADALRAAREERAAAAVAEERARVAIGVHDAIAHRVGEISLQAEGALRVAGGEPGRALATLARIEDAGRAALDDIREVIGVLRREDDLGLEVHRAAAVPLPAPWDERPPAEPAPGTVAAPKTRPAPADVALAAALFAALAIETLTSSRQVGGDLANLAGLALIALPVLALRHAPLTATAAVFAASASMAALLTPPTYLVTAIALLLVPAYAVAAHAPLRSAAAGLGICVAGTLVIEPAVPSVVLGLVAWGAGRVVRDRGLRAQELHRVTRELEAAGGAHAAHARGEERLRLARELHDAVAHSMTVIVLQAAAAQRVWGDDPAAARVAVGALAEVARETLAGLRETLRADRPARLGAVDELVASVRPLGLDVDLDCEPLELPPELDHVAFCVVREALTNAARHAAPTSVRVRLHRSGEEVRIEVADTGRGAGASGAALPGTGTGLHGMAERVAACGGELRYGRAGPGFSVEARLPLGVPVAA